MKKLLMGSVVLLIFSISIMIFQMSCKKAALADAPVIVTTSTPTTVFQEGKMFFLTSDNNIGIENYDGTNQQNLHISLPSGNKIPVIANISISPDHKTIFFAVTDEVTSNGKYGYACNIDGTNVRKVDNSSWHLAF